MACTTTNNVTQIINGSVRPYINEKYINRSSDEPLADLNEFKIAATETIVSLDVETIFTAISFADVIYIIIDATHIFALHL